MGELGSELRGAMKPIPQPEDISAMAATEASKRERCTQVLRVKRPRGAR